MSFYDHMIERRLQSVTSDLGARFRSNIWNRLNSENLDVATRYANYNTIETCLLAQAASRLLEKESPVSIQLIHTRGGDSDKGSEHYLDSEKLDRYIEEELTNLFANMTHEIDNTHLFPFGMDKEDTFDKEGNPVKVSNMRTLTQVKALAEELNCHWVVMYDCYLDRQMSSERVAHSSFGSSWTDFHRVDKKQHDRIYGRVFLLSNSNEAVSYMTSEYQTFIFSHLSLPVIVESSHTSGYARKWWVFQIPLDK